VRHERESLQMLNAALALQENSMDSGSAGGFSVDRVKAGFYSCLYVLSLQRWRHVLLYVFAAVWVGSERDFFQPTRQNGWVSFSGETLSVWKHFGRRKR
jgi:hypothetical protein